MCIQNMIITLTLKGWIWTEWSNLCDITIIMTLAIWNAYSIRNNFDIVDNTNMKSFESIEKSKIYLFWSEVWCFLNDGKHKWVRIIKDAMSLRWLKTNHIPLWLHLSHTYMMLFKDDIIVFFLTQIFKN